MCYDLSQYLEKFWRCSCVCASIEVKQFRYRPGVAQRVPGS